MTLGQKDDLYFNALASYAQEAVDSDVPLPYFLDPEGNESRDNYTLAFRNWCEARRVKIEACLKAFLEQALDVYYLAMLRDRRAIPILRKGVASENVAVVHASAEGLGWLNDAESIPLIEAGVRHLRPKLQPLAASALAQFDDPRVGKLLDEFVKDSKWRGELNDTIRKRHTEATKQ